MNIVIFPGQSSRNAQWQNELCSEIGETFPSAIVSMTEYSFWKNYSNNLSDEEIIKNEITLVYKKYKNSAIDTIVGKSFGAYVALEVAQKLNPKRLVLIGLPAQGMLDYNIKIQDLLYETITPTIIVNNVFDPQLGNLDLQTVLRKNNFIDKIILINSDTHKYLDVGFYAQILT